MLLDAAAHRILPDIENGDLSTTTCGYRAKVVKTRKDHYSQAENDKSSIKCIVLRVALS